MKLVPVTLSEEICGEKYEFIIYADAQLDLDSGDISIKSYYTLEEQINKEQVRKEYDFSSFGLPANHEEYEFTSGLLRIQDKELEFGVNVNVDDGSYEVTVDELEQIKEKALSLVSSDKNKKAPTNKKGKGSKY